MTSAQPGDLFDVFEITIIAIIATPILVFIALLLAWGAGSRLMSVQRQQVEELVRLRNAVTALQRKQPASAAGGETGELPRIGASNRVFQTGDRVEIIDGVHRGDYGTIASTPDWVREGFVCVDLVGGRGQRYMATSKLAHFGEGDRQ